MSAARATMRDMRTPLALLIALALTACPGPAPKPSAHWSFVFHGIANGLVSVAGTSATDVWSCGGDIGDGTGPLVLHFDGKSWKRFPTGVTGDLWWIMPFADGTTYFAGDDGHILQEKNGTFTPMTTPGGLTVFGVWGTAPDNLWAVGGDADNGIGFIWRYDGTAWTPLTAPGGIGETNAFFKVWGSSKDDVWIVGQGGHVLHWDGQALTDANTDPKLTGSERTLFTLSGAGGRVAAVGGFASAFIIERSGSGSFVNATPAGAMGLSGVDLTSATDGWAVGAHLTVLHRDQKGWSTAPTKLSAADDLHAVWVDPSGGVWAVGGDILALPLTHGTMIHYGLDVPGGSFTP